MKFSVNGPTSTLLLHPASFVPTMRTSPSTCDVDEYAITSFDEFDYVYITRDYYARFFHLVRSANFFAHESSDVITENIKRPLLALLREREGYIKVLTLTYMDVWRIYSLASTLEIILHYEILSPSFNCYSLLHFSGSSDHTLGVSVTFAIDRFKPSVQSIRLLIWHWTRGNETELFPS